MVTCRECGTKNPIGSEFCDRCGAVLPPAAKLVCPQCETPNPPDRLYCEQCGTRLVQDDSPQEPADDSIDQPTGRAEEPFSIPEQLPDQSANLEAGGEIPEWLRTIESETPAPPTAEEDIPDWLQNVPEPLAVDDDLDSDNLESSDAEWLADFTALVEPAEEADAPVEEEPLIGGELPADAELPDWLWADADQESEVVGGDSTPEVAADQPSAEEPAAEQTEAMTPSTDSEPEEQVPDWLAGIVGAEETGPEAAPAAQEEVGPATEEEVPAWLAALQDEEDDVDAQVDMPPSADIGEEPAVTPSAGGEEAAGEETAAPDWLSGVVADDEIPPAEETRLPAWMVGLTGEIEEDEDEAPAPLPAGEEEDEPTDVPDWLVSLDEDDAAIGKPALDHEDLPDWLAQISPQGEGILPVDEDNLAELETLDALFESELAPDLASETGPEQETESELEPEQDQDAIADHLPSALAGAATLAVAAEMGAADRAEPDSEDEWDESTEAFDDWVTAFDSSLTGETETDAEPEFDLSDLDDQDLPDWLLEPVGNLAADLPAEDQDAELLSGDELSPEDLSVDDLAIADAEQAEAEPARKPVTGELTNIPAQLVGADLPDWLQDNPLAVDLPEGETPLEEVPDWLQPAGEDAFDDLLALDEAEAAALASSGEWAALLEDLPAAGEPMPPDESLSTADIPEWLEAMRPTGSLLVAGAAAVAGQDAIPEPVPQAGPLAGLAGVIRIEPMVASPRVAERSPVAFSISPEQRNQVDLLRQLLTEERRPPAVVTPLRKRDLPSPLRIVLGFLLLAVVVIGLFLPAQVETELPEPPAVLPVHGAISEAANRPVLVAFEYTPAMAGEMSPQAVTLLTELAAQNSPVMLVSQSAAGLTIAEEIAQAINGLSAETLALVPGEAVGLRQLGSCIADQAGCATLYGQSLTDEQSAALENLGLVLVFAAERDGLVSWMEQVSPQVEVPLVAGVTQALAPVAMPYFNSDQVQGLMAGFPAMVAYEQAAGQKGPQSEIVWAVTLAQWVAVAALIVGNIFWVIEGTVRRDA